MSGPASQPLSNQEAAEAWEEARFQEHCAANRHLVQFSPALRTESMDAYHERCRAMFQEWDPDQFGDLQHGDVVLVRCTKCIFGTIDPEKLYDHFEASGHWPPDQRITGQTLTPVYGGEGQPGTEHGPPASSASARPRANPRSEA